MATTAGLLADDEPPAVVMLREKGQSPFLLTCDHAGNRLPRGLGSLGLDDQELQRHIAWDIGAAGLTRLMADRLDAVAILQTYSRLVIDCNRTPGNPTSIAEVSEHTVIPGNTGLSPAERKLRLDAVFTPYHGRISAELDRRRDQKVPTALIALHSFTPVFKGVARPWHVGLLYNRDSRMAKAMAERLGQEPGLVVGDNEPYVLDDESDYTIPVHAERRGLPYIEIEVRQDLIAGEDGQKIWAQLLARILISSWEAIAQ